MRSAACLPARQICTLPAAPAVYRRTAADLLTLLRSSQRPDASHAGLVKQSTAGRAGLGGPSLARAALRCPCCQSAAASTWSFQYNSCSLRNCPSMALQSHTTPTHPLGLLGSWLDLLKRDPHTQSVLPPPLPAATPVPRPGGGSSRQQPKPKKCSLPKDTSRPRLPPQPPQAARGRGSAPAFSQVLGSRSSCTVSPELTWCGSY